MFSSTTSLVGVCVMLMVCATAILAGRWPERLAGSVVAVAWILSEALEDFDLAHKAQPMIFGIDCVLALGFLLMLVSTRRTWVVWAFAYQMLIVLTHVGAALMTEVSRWDFFVSYYVWSYAVIAALLAGVVFEGRWAEAWPGSNREPA